MFVANSDGYIRLNLACPRSTSHYNHKSLAILRLQALITYGIIFLYNAPSRNERIAVLHHCRNRAIHLHPYHSTSSS